MEQTHLNGGRLNPWRTILVTILSMGSLYLIMWTGLRVWQQSCSHPARLALRHSPDCSALFLELMPLLVALGFWSTGLVVWSTAQPHSLAEFFLIGAGTLAAGEMSSLDDTAGVKLFYLFMVWLAPLTFHFHHKLLGHAPKYVGRSVLFFFYVLAISGSLPFVIWNITTLQTRGWYMPLRLGIRLNLALALVLTIGLLLWRYHRDTSPVARRRIRLVTFGTLAAFAPLLLLSLLPDTLGAPFHIPYEVTFPWLLLSPLAYLYTLFRYRWLGLEGWLTRAAVIYLMAILLLSSYVIGITFSNHLAMFTGPWLPVGALVAVSLLMILFMPLQQGLYRLTNWVFYGGEINYGTLIKQWAEGLALTLDRQTLQRTLVDELTMKLQITGSTLLLENEAGRLVVAAACGFEQGDPIPPHLPSDGRLATYLEAVAEPVTTGQIRRALAPAALKATEQALLALDIITFWLPLVSSGTLHGILLLGHKLGGDYFTAEDRRILTILAHQAGIAAHNVRLMEQVRAGRQELARAHRQLLIGREQERRQLAHELHDGAVQQLLGISYQVVECRRRLSQQDELDQPARVALTALLDTNRQEMLRLVRQLRRLIGELRPAGLEELGLTAALEGYTARLEREKGSDLPQIHLDLDKSGTTLPEPVAICLFRTAQEALRNALKHAGAQHITLRFCLRSGEAALNVHDDGCGFRVPGRLSELAQTDHFGLVGMAERVKWAGGRFTIRSRPGQGTEIIVRIPVTEKMPTNGKQRG